MQNHWKHYQYGYKYSQEYFDPDIGYIWIKAGIAMQLFEFFMEFWHIAVLLIDTFMQT
jgi:hypothetical protein